MPDRRDAIVVLVVAASCVTISVLFMAGRMRPDQIVYGRYNDTAIVPVLIVGLAFLLTENSRRRLITAVGSAVALSLGCAAVLLAWRRDALESGSGIEPMILGLQPFVRQAESIDVVGITLAAITIMVLVGVVAGVARHVDRPLLTLVAVGALVLIGSARTSRVIDSGWHGRGDLSSVGELADGPLAGGVPVDFLLPDGTSSDRLMLYQMYLPTNRFTVVEGSSDSGTATFIFAPLDDPILQQSATLEWTDPKRKLGLWER